jgi:hypothetical protein
MTRCDSRRGERGFVMLWVLVVGAVLFVLLSAATHVYYGLHQHNRSELKRLQTQCSERALSLTAER